MCGLRQISSDAMHVFQAAMMSFRAFSELELNDLIVIRCSQSGPDLHWTSLFTIVLIICRRSRMIHADVPQHSLPVITGP